MQRGTPLSTYGMAADIGARRLPPGVGIMPATAAAIGGRSPASLRADIASRPPGDMWDGEGLFQASRPRTVPMGAGSRDQRIVPMEGVPTNEGNNEPVAHQRAIRGLTVGDASGAQFVSPMPRQYELLLLARPSEIASADADRALEARAAANAFPQLQPLALDQDTFTVQWAEPVPTTETPVVTPTVANYLLLSEVHRFREKFTGDNAYRDFMRHMQMWNAFEEFDKRFWLCGVVEEDSMADQAGVAKTAAFADYTYSPSVANVEGVVEPRRKMVTYALDKGPTFIQDYWTQHGARPGAGLSIVVNMFLLKGRQSFVMSNQRAVLEQTPSLMRDIVIPPDEEWPVPQLAFVARPDARRLPSVYLHTKTTGALNYEWVGREIRIGQVFSREQDRKHPPSLGQYTLPTDVTPFRDERTAKIEMPPIKVSLQMSQVGLF